MSLPVTEQKDYCDLSEKEQSKITSYKRDLHKYKSDSFEIFLEYLLITAYETPEDYKSLLQIMADAKPEYIQKLMYMTDNDVVSIKIGHQYDLLLLNLPIRIIKTLRNKVGDFVLQYAAQRFGKSKVELTSPSDYYQFIDEEFQKAFRIWLSPENKLLSQLRKSRRPKLLMNIPHEPRIVQPKTNAVEQREVLLLTDTPKREQIRKGPIIEEVDSEDADADIDDKFEEPTPQNNEEKEDNVTEEPKVIVAGTRVEPDGPKPTTNPNGLPLPKEGSDLKKITLTERKPRRQDFGHNLRGGNETTYYMALRTYELRQLRQQRRNQILSARRKQMTEQNSKEDLKNITIEEK